MVINFVDFSENLQDMTKEVISSLNENVEESWKSSPEEPYGLRRFNPNRSEDTQRFKDIDRHPAAVKWMDPPEKSSNEDLDYLIHLDESDKKDPRIIWAITNEANEAVGWIQFYPDKHLSHEKLLENGFPEYSLVLETSYTKLFNQWPEYSHFINDRTNLDEDSNPAVAINGLKQSLIRLVELEDLMAKDSKIGSRTICVTAYTDPNNAASEKVLETNGFTNIGLVDYDGEQNNAWIKKLN